MTRGLDGLDLVAFMVDGVHDGEHTCVVALGIGIDGVKHALASRKATPRTRLGHGPITGQRDRGLDVTRQCWLSWTGPRRVYEVKAVFDKPLISAASSTNSAT